MVSLDDAVLARLEKGGSRYEILVDPHLVENWKIDNESVKISVRFLTNEIRSDALNIKIFYKKCETVVSCKITEQDGNLKTELLKKILKQAAIYEQQSKDKNFKPYTGSLSNIK